MNNAHNDETRRRRILVLLLVLFICSSSAVALGYAYTNTSKTTNTENIITGEGLETRLLGLDGEVLGKGGFATDNKSWWTPVHNTDGNPVYGDPVVLENVLIGEALLEIVTSVETVNQVKIWYMIEWTEGNGETRLNIGDFDSIAALGPGDDNDETNTVVLDLEHDATRINVSLYGEITPENGTAKYNITFYVLPVF